MNSSTVVPSLLIYSIFLHTQNDNQCGTGWSGKVVLSSEIHTVPAPNCLGSVTLLLFTARSNKSVLWMSSPSEFQVNSASHLATSVAPIFARVSDHYSTIMLSLLLPRVHGFPGVPLPLACPLLSPVIAAFLLPLG